MGFFKQILGGFVAAPAFPPPAPSRRTYVVGDIHGRDDLLRRLLRLIEADLVQVGEGAQIVFAGDYVDRGPDSAAVLARLMRLHAERPRHVTCLMGNHERMLLDFLDDPTGKGALWLRSGGRDTLASFGIKLRGMIGPDEAEGLAGTLGDVMGSDMVRWLRALRRRWVDGTLAVVHASADPLLPIAAQSEKVLLWGNADVPLRPRSDGLWITHGHTVVDAPVASRGRIAIDTGAYFTGRLTAAVIEPGDLVTFLTT